MRRQTTARMIAGAREMSDTVNDEFVTDPEVLDRCNESLAEEYETIVGTYERYNVSTKSFTLTGGAAGGVGVDRVVLPDDFFKELVVIRDPGTSSRFRVRRLPSLAEMTRRDELCFDLLDDELVIFPAERASGNYQLLYTPQAPALVDPVIVVKAGDAVNGATNVLFLQNGQFDQGYVGATVTLAGCTNPSNNASFVILSVTNTAVVTLTGVLVTEAFNPVSVTAQSTPTNAFDELPLNMLPWGELIKVGAAIRIKDKKGQSTDSLERRLPQLRTRIEQLAADRASDPQQVPLSRSTPGDWDGFP